MLKISQINEEIFLKNNSVILGPESEKWIAPNNSLAETSRVLELLLFEH